jgi:hypothetical protein
LSQTSANFEQSHVSGSKSKSEEPPHKPVEESIEGALRLKILGHDVGAYIRMRKNRRTETGKRKIPKLTFSNSDSLSLPAPLLPIPSPVVGRGSG